jgi:hypothetical protein
MAAMPAMATAATGDRAAVARQPATQELAARVVVGGDELAAGEAAHVGGQRGGVGVALLRLARHGLAHHDRQVARHARRQLLEGRRGPARTWSRALSPR